MKVNERMAKLSAHCLTLQLLLTLYLVCYVLTSILKVSKWGVFSATSCCKHFPVVDILGPNLKRLCR